MSMGSGAEDGCTARARGRRWGKIGLSRLRAAECGCFEDHDHDDFMPESSQTTTVSPRLSHPPTSHLQTPSYRHIPTVPHPSSIKPHTCPSATLVHHQPVIYPSPTQETEHSRIKKNQILTHPSHSLEMAVDRYKHFRWTPRTAWITVAYVCIVPSIMGYFAYTTDVS